MCFTTIIYVGKKVTTFFRAGDHFGDQWIANKMGMIANMILNFPVDPMVTLVIIICWL